MMTRHILINQQQADVGLTMDFFNAAAAIGDMEFLRNRQKIPMEKVVQEIFNAAAIGDMEFLRKPQKISHFEIPKIVMKRNPQGDTVCHVALQHGHVDFAIVTIECYQPLIFEANELGDTPLHSWLKHASPKDFVNRLGHLLSNCLEDYIEDLKNLSARTSGTIVNKEGKSLIYLAVEKGYKAVVEHLLTLDLWEGHRRIIEENGLHKFFEVDRVDGPNGSTALHLAVREAKLDIIRILLKYRARLFVQQDGDGNTPLHLAVTVDNPEIVEMIAAANAHPLTVLNKDGILPFHLAASLGHLEIFKCFLRLDPDCYLKTTNKGQNALHIAIQEKSISIVDYIVKDEKLVGHMTNQQDEDGNTPLHVAASKGFDKLLNALLKGSGKALPLKNKEGLTFDGVAKARKEQFFNAAKAGDIEFLKELDLDNLWSSRDTLRSWNPQGDTVCHVALQRGHVEFALMAAYIYPPLVFEPNRLGDTPLHTALKHGRADMIMDRLHSLLEECLRSYHEDLRNHSACTTGTIVNKEGKSLIYLAAEKGHEDVVSYLITLQLGEDFCRKIEEYGLHKFFEVDRVDGPNGSTALHLAVSEAKPDIIRILLEHRAELSEQIDGTGHTPLHLAVTMNNLQLVEMIVNADAYAANVLSKDGISPFHLAASLGHLEIFKKFLIIYPDCYLETTNKGKNALHIAVQEKSNSIVEYIVKDEKLGGHMINQRDEDGNTPLHVAASKGFDKMLNALLAGSAEVLPLKNNEDLTFHDVAKARKEREKREKMRMLITTAKDFQSSLLVLTALITTVTFSAAFTLPGGNNEKGIANHVKRLGFAVFLISNIMSMSSSIIATAALILFSAVPSIQRRFDTLKMAIGALGISIIFMLLAVASGVCLLIGSQRQWLAIFIAIVIACTPLLLIFLVWRIITGSGPSGNEDDDLEHGIN